jgi:hypothetical protein
MLYFFFLCLIVPVVYSTRRSYAGGKVEINHVTLFTAGFLTYWMLPIGIALMLNSQVENALGGDLMNLYEGLGNMGEYLIVCEIIYFSCGRYIGSQTESPVLRKTEAGQRNYPVLVLCFGKLDCSNCNVYGKRPFT